MKYIKQLMIILIISCIGELLNFFIPLPIPGSIYVMILLFILLCCGVIKLSQIKETGDFLMDIMPILFVPSAVGIISQLEHLKTIWIQIIIITIVTTFLVMGITGLITQVVIRMKRGKNKKCKKNSCKY